jgi:hypothetical protein
MAWTTPVEWIADQLVTAADLNEQIRDNLLILVTPLTTASGKITDLSSTTLESLDGTNLTGLAKTASANTLTATNDFNSGSGRVVIPVGTDKWAT